MNKKTSADEVLEAIEGTELKVEADRSWLWLTEPDVAPAHKVKGGCKCEECNKRTAFREKLKEIGFKFSFADHKLNSGKSSRWGHNCGIARPFRKGPPRNQHSPPAAQEEKSFDEEMSEAEAFFNSL